MDSARSRYWPLQDSLRASSMSPSILMATCSPCWTTGTQPAASAVDICHYLWPTVLGPLGAAAIRAPDIATACMLLLSHYKLIDPYNTYELMPDSNGIEITVALPHEAHGHPRMLDFLLCATFLLYGVAMSIHPHNRSIGLRGMVVTFHGLEDTDLAPVGTYYPGIRRAVGGVFIPQIGPTSLRPITPIWTTASLPRCCCRCWRFMGLVNSQCLIDSLAYSGLLGVNPVHHCQPSRRCLP